MVTTKREDVTKQGFCKIFWWKICLRGSLSIFCGVGAGRGVGWEWALIWVWLGIGERRGGVGWALTRGLTFSAIRMGANSRLGAYSNKYGNTYEVVVEFQMQICLILLFSWSILVKFCVHLRTSSNLNFHEPRVRSNYGKHIYKLP